MVNLSPFRRLVAYGNRLVACATLFQTRSLRPSAYSQLSLSTWIAVVSPPTARTACPVAALNRLRHNAVRWMRAIRSGPVERGLCASRE